MDDSNTFSPNMTSFFQVKPLPQKPPDSHVTRKPGNVSVAYGSPLLVSNTTLKSREWANDNTWTPQLRSNDAFSIIASSADPVNNTQSPHLENSINPPQPTQLEMTSESSSPFYLSNDLPQGTETPKSEKGGAWPVSSMGNGNAARTSRVIERLGKELDRSKREISLLTAKLEEEQHCTESSKLSLESLRDSATHYETMYVLAQKTIARKDRKIADVKAELQVENIRRERAEEEKAELANLMASMTSQSQLEIAKEKELASFANTQYEALRGALSNHEQSLAEQIAQVRLEFDSLKRHCQSESESLQRLNSISRELCETNAVMESTYQDTFQLYELYRSKRDQSLRSIADEAERIEAKGDRLVAEMQETLGKMKYVVNVKETFIG